MTRKHQPADERRQQILDAALDVVRAGGPLTRRQVAERIGTGMNLINHYFSMTELEEWVMQQAVLRDMPDIIAYGIRIAHPTALTAPATLRARAVALLGGDI